MGLKRVMVGTTSLSSGGMEYIGGGKVCSLPGSTVMDVE